MSERTQNTGHSFANGNGDSPVADVNGVGNESGYPPPPEHWWLRV